MPGTAASIAIFGYGRNSCSNSENSPRQQKRFPRRREPLLLTSESGKPDIRAVRLPRLSRLRLRQRRYRLKSGDRIPSAAKGNSRRLNTTAAAGSAKIPKYPSELICFEITIGTQNQAGVLLFVYDLLQMRNPRREQNGSSRQGRPPLRNRCELAGHSRKNAGSGAPGLPEPYTIPQTVSNRGRRNSGSNAPASLVGKSSISIGKYEVVGYEYRSGCQLRFVGGVHSSVPKGFSNFP